MNATPEYLVIGHVTFDLTPDGISLGGPGFYSSLTLSNMGRKVALVTSGITPEFNIHLDQLEVVNIPSQVTTTFENRESDGSRTQKIHVLASKIKKLDVPRKWHNTPTVLLSPVASEINPRILDLFHNSSIAVSPQGWMRKWGDDGIIQQSELGARASFFDKAQVVVFSHTDIPRCDSTYLNSFTCSVLIMTLGNEGAYLRWKNNWFYIPPYPTIEVDTTGCGDVFMAAYLIRYNETKDPLQSALFASCAGSLCAEGSGHIAIPNKTDVINRMNQFPNIAATPVDLPK